MEEPSYEAVQESFWQGPPIILMSLLCHTSILRLDKELRSREKSQVGRVIRTVIIQIAFPVYVLIGAGGYILHGNKVSPNVLEDFPRDGWMAAARLLLGIMNMVKIPMGVVTLREEIVSSLPSASLRRSMRRPMGRVAATAVVMCSGASAAASLGSLSHVLSLVGCTVGVAFSLCLPSALYFKLLSSKLLRIGAKGAASEARAGLSEPLLDDHPGRGAVCGAVKLPSNCKELRLQQLSCLVIFISGLIVGGLGLNSWLKG
eukprot:TRINITY_DN82878_c0_g1_i1.p1 TRINITY_DN82878_c0_g1~~TRINITY_DN82878_c0_g1_i1.p1  ORF type:complete len:296 (-),score=35.05 TRINITY_DN82878_c0_g1_i1:68-847(-)